VFGLLEGKKINKNVRNEKMMKVRFFSLDEKNMK